MAIHRFWRKARVKAPRRRRTAPLMSATTGLSGAARRVNRVVAVVALFGAFGTVALAVALTPGAQTSASSATAPQEDFQISRIEVPPAPVAAATANTTVVAVQPPPEPAPKADRLYRAPRTLEDRNAQSPASPGATDIEQSTEREVAMTDTADMADMADMAEQPAAAREAAESAGHKLDEDAGRDFGFALSEPSAPGESREAAAEDIKGVHEAVREALDEAPDEVSDDATGDIADEIADEPAADEAEEAATAALETAALETAAPEPAASAPAAPEVAATRTAPVTTDVNMRARPSNGAAVIQVVPGKSTVEVIGCDYWCEVVYEGRRGWIYKGFVRGS